MGGVGVGRGTILWGGYGRIWVGWGGRGKVA